VALRALHTTRLLVAPGSSGRVYCPMKCDVVYSGIQEALTEMSKRNLPKG
jgi:hypothetical protein